MGDCSRIIWTVSSVQMWTALRAPSEEVHRVQGDESHFLRVQLILPYAPWSQSTICAGFSKRRLKQFGVPVPGFQRQSALILSSQETAQGDLWVCWAARGEQVKGRFHSGEFQWRLPWNSFSAYTDTLAAAPVSFFLMTVRGDWLIKANMRCSPAASLQKRNRMKTRGKLWVRERRPEQPTEYSLQLNPPKRLGD